MSFIYKNENCILENKKYYNNIIVKIRKYEDILLMCSDIRFLNIYKSYSENIILNLKFYKPARFMNYNISLEIIYKYLMKKIPEDLALKIFKYYLNDNISFKYIKEKYINPIQINIKYCNKLNKYIFIINEKDLVKNHIYKNDIVRDILVLKIIENCKKLLNNKKKIDIKNIFELNDKEIELNDLFKIQIGKSNGWGLIWI